MSQALARLSAGLLPTNRDVGKNAQVPIVPKSTSTNKRVQLFSCTEVLKTSPSACMAFAETLLKCKQGELISLWIICLP